MANKKKSKSDLVLIGSMVPKSTAKVLRLMAQAEDKSVSKLVKQLLEGTSQFQEARKQIEAA